MGWRRIQQSASSPKNAHPRGQKKYRRSGRASVSHIGKGQVTRFGERRIIHFTILLFHSNLSSPYFSKKIPCRGFFWFSNGGEREIRSPSKKRLVTKCAIQGTFFPTRSSSVSLRFRISHLNLRKKTKTPILGCFLVFKLAERGRFELPVGCPTHPFQGCALGHYATSPYFTIILNIFFECYRGLCLSVLIASPVGNEKYVFKIYKRDHLYGKTFFLQKICK